MRCSSPFLVRQTTRVGHVQPLILNLADSVTRASTIGVELDSCFVQNGGWKCTILFEPEYGFISTSVRRSTSTNPVRMPAKWIQIGRAREWNFCFAQI